MDGGMERLSVWSGSDFENCIFMEDEGERNLFVVGKLNFVVSHHG